MHRLVAAECTRRELRQIDIADFSEICHALLLEIGVRGRDFFLSHFRASCFRMAKIRLELAGPIGSRKQ